MNNIIVQKFGGTSVANIDRIIHVSEVIKQTLDQGKSVVVVVSAMSGVTNQLISYCLDISKLTLKQEIEEYDAVLSSGENVTAGLLSLALQRYGIVAKSLQGWQIPIITNDSFSTALIKQIDTSILLNYIKANIIPVITGFQGVTIDNRITTLGRGGSDTTAVALAASLNAIRCDIYTDVEGVFTADPRLIKEAKHIPIIDSMEMLNFASFGAKIIHPRAVSLAIKYNISIRIISSFTNNNNTMIYNQEQTMEETKITGITYDNNIIMFQMECKKVEFIDIIFKNFMNQNIATNLITYIDKQLLTVVSLNDLGKLCVMLESINNINYKIDTEVVLISIVGLGINNNIIYDVYQLLSSHNIEIIALINNPTKINIIVNIKHLEFVIKILHAELFSMKT